MDFETSLRTTLEQWQHLGQRTLSTGTVQIGHVPHVAPQAYLFLLFPGLEENEIDGLERACGIPFPSSLRRFYRRHNGISLYSDSLAIDGLQGPLVRTGDGAIQPYSMLTTNVHERATGTPANVLFIGGYNYDGSRLCMLPDGTVCRTPRDRWAVTNTWDSLEAMLVAELDRLAQFFDDQGVQDLSRSTTP